MSATHDRRLGDTAFIDLPPDELPMAITLQIANGTIKPTEIQEATCLAIYGFLLANDMAGLAGFFNQMNAVLDMRPSAPVADVWRCPNEIGDEMLLLVDADEELVRMEGRPATYSVTVIQWIAEWAMGTDCGTIQ